MSVNLKWWIGVVYARARRIAEWLISYNTYIHTERVVVALLPKTFFDTAWCETHVNLMPRTQSHDGYSDTHAAVCARVCVCVKKYTYIEQHLIQLQAEEYKCSILIR